MLTNTIPRTAADPPARRARRALVVVTSMVLAATVPGLAAPAHRNPQSHPAASRALRARATTAVPRFPDVPKNHWAYQAVHGLAARRILTGAPDAPFDGDRPVTRYEFAAALYRMVQALDSSLAHKAVPLAKDKPQPLEDSPPPPSSGAPKEPTSGGSGAGSRAAVAVPPGPNGPASWLVDNLYLSNDSPLAQPPFTAPVSPALFSDSLAYVTDRIMLHRATPEEQERERQNAE